MHLIEGEPHRCLWTQRAFSVQDIFSLVKLPDEIEVFK